MGELSYTDDELGLLTGPQRSDLAVLTAFGAVVSGDRLDELAEPLVQRDRRGMLLERLTAEAAVREAGLTDAELRRRYAEDPAHELEVRHLVILSERWESAAERAEARSRAEAALERARSGEDFAELAGEVSEEPGAAERGGLLDPGRRGSWVDEFWSAASALDEGEISPVVETEYGFHVIKLEERRPIPFREVRGQVLARLIDLERAIPDARRWAARQTRAVSPDTAAIRTFRSAPADSLVLARWDGGAYTGRDFRFYIAGLEPDAQDRLARTTMDGYASVVGSAARNRVLVRRAEEMGLAVSDDELAAIRDAHLTRLRGWAASLGFEANADPAHIKEAAMRALSADRQRSRIARTGVLALGPALRALVPIREPGPAAVSG